MISIIVPVYNAEKYIDACIRSVVDQKYDNYELILIDDGSNDCTREIIEKWTNKYESVRLLCQNHTGQGSARNYGVKESKGKWLMFLDADDEMVEDALGHVARCLDSDQDMYFFEYYEQEDYQKKRSKMVDIPLGKRDMMTFISTFLWDKVIKKEHWINNQIVLSDLYGEDLIAVYKMLVNAKGWKNINYPIVIHYQRKDNLTSNPHKVRQLTQSINNLLGNFRKEMLFEYYELELYEICKRQLEIWRELNEKNSNQYRDVVDNLELLLKTNFEILSNMLPELQSKNLVVVGNVYINERDLLKFHHIYIYSCLEEFIFHDEREKDIKTYYIINIDNEINHIKSNTRTEMWEKNTFIKHCHEICAITEKELVADSFFLYKSVEKSNIINTFEKNIIEILGCKVIEHDESIQRTISMSEQLNGGKRKILKPYMENKNKNYRGELYRLDVNNNVYACLLKKSICGDKVSKYFLDRALTKIAVYGAGDLGKVFVELLEKEGIVPVCIIDQSKNNTISGYQTLTMDEEWPEIDIVVVCVPHLFYSIRTNIYSNALNNEKLLYDVVSIVEIVGYKG